MIIISREYGSWLTPPVEMRVVSEPDTEPHFRNQSFGSSLRSASRSDLQSCHPCILAHLDWTRLVKITSMNPPKIVVPDDCPPLLATSSAFQSLRGEIPEIDYFNTLPGSPHTLIERIRDAEVVINIRSSSSFTAEVFQSCPRLRLVSVWGTGTDNVDLAAAVKRAVTVTNTPAVSAYSVAEHALTIMLAAARRLPAQDAAVRNGGWPRGQGVELRGKTLGIVGLGAIGRRFAELGRGIGMRVIAWTPHPQPVLDVELVEFEQLLRVSDVVSIHLRLTDQTRSMFGSRQFSLMKPTAILVNTARGAIMDETALVDALSMGRIAGAGLDVFSTEPLPAAHALTRLDNVVLTPHCAGITPEALEAGLRMAVENVRSFLGGAPVNVVAHNPALDH
jgi:phosphoglycerate dehydrogenase-like enzyme